MADNERVICASAALAEKGTGIRFDLPELGESVTGFVVRYNGTPYAFVNQCAHVPIELDWNEGEFFDLTRQYLICATHGAHYLPDTGYCVMGPCRGKSLMRIPVTERDNQILIHF